MATKKPATKAKSAPAAKGKRQTKTVADALQSVRVIGTCITQYTGELVAISADLLKIKTAKEELTLYMRDVVSVSGEVGSEATVLARHHGGVVVQFVGVVEQLEDGLVKVTDEEGSHVINANMDGFSVVISESSDSDEEAEEQPSVKSKAAPKAKSKSKSKSDDLDEDDEDLDDDSDDLDDEEDDLDDDSDDLDDDDEDLDDDSDDLDDDDEDLDDDSDDLDDDEEEVKPKRGTKKQAAPAKKPAAKSRR